MELLKVPGVIGQDGAVTCPFATRRSTKGSATFSSANRRAMASGFLVQTDGVVDFLAMAGVVIPRCIELGLRQRRRIARANLLVAQPEVLGLDEHPDGDAAVPDAG